MEKLNEKQKQILKMIWCASKYGFAEAHWTSYQELYIHLITYTDILDELDEFEDVISKFQKFGYIDNILSPKVADFTSYLRITPKGEEYVTKYLVGDE